MNTNSKKASTNSDSNLSYSVQEGLNNSERVSKSGIIKSVEHENNDKSGSGKIYSRRGSVMTDIEDEDKLSNAKIEPPIKLWIRDLKGGEIPIQTRQIAPSAVSVTDRAARRKSRAESKPEWNNSLNVSDNFDKSPSIAVRILLFQFLIKMAQRLELKRRGLISDRARD